LENLSKYYLQKQEKLMDRTGESLPRMTDDAEVPLELQVGPVVQRVAETEGHRLSPFLELLPVDAIERVAAEGLAESLGKILYLASFPVIPRLI
jgi:hypothetical protein